jgi:hypothetical protein
MHAIEDDASVSFCRVEGNRNVSTGMNADARERNRARYCRLKTQHANNHKFLPLLSLVIRNG